MKIEDFGWVDNWQIRSKADVHPSHATPVMEFKEIIRRLNWILDWSEEMHMKELIEEFKKDLESVRK